MSKPLLVVGMVKSTDRESLHLFKKEIEAKYPGLDVMIISGVSALAVVDRDDVGSEEGGEHLGLGSFDQSHRDAGGAQDPVQVPVGADQVDEPTTLPDRVGDRVGQGDEIDLVGERDGFVPVGQVLGHEGASSSSVGRSESEPLAVSPSADTEVAPEGTAGLRHTSLGGVSDAPPSAPSPIVITINGAVDPAAVGREIEKTLDAYRRGTGRGRAW